LHEVTKYAAEQQEQKTCPRLGIIISKIQS